MAKVIDKIKSWCCNVNEITLSYVSYHRVTEGFRSYLINGQRKPSGEEDNGRTNVTLVSDNKQKAGKTNMNRIFYRADSGYTADIIPFYDNGKYYLFYLHDYRDHERHGEGTPWHCVSTTDFIRFEEHGEVIPRGMKEDQDLYIFTGCVFKESDGRYHIFYTGHNPNLRAQGKPEQAVMHAVSQDLLHWEKVPEDTFYAPTDTYEMHDWRDPFVFWNEEAGQYWMLLAARTIEGPQTRRGCTALCVSNDLKRWEVADPLWAPQYHFTHECPDLFRIGDWWYLIYSEFSDRCLTRYRMAKDLKGPWLAPHNDSFDGRPYYAAKSASDGEKRYLFGWNPTKGGNDDHRHWDWGGQLVVHEIYQQADGSLGVKVPDSVRGYYDEPVTHAGPIALESESGFANARIDAKLGCAYRIRAKVTFDGKATKLGVQLRYNEAADESYVFTLETSKDRLSFGQFPIQPWNPANYTNVTRPIRFEADRSYELDIYVEDDVCVAYLDGRLALNARMHRNPGEGLALFAADGNARFDEVTVYRPSKPIRGGDDET